MSKAPMPHWIRAVAKHIACSPANLPWHRNDRRRTRADYALLGARHVTPRGTLLPRGML